MLIMSCKEYVDDFAGFMASRRRQVGADLQLADDATLTLNCNSRSAENPNFSTLSD